MKSETKKTVEELLRQPTMSVPEAGMNFYGLSFNGSYQAASRGEIPTIEIGRKKRVPTVALATKLGLKANIGGQADA